jgi:hypothetical protein
LGASRCRKLVSCHKQQRAKFFDLKCFGLGMYLARLEF